MAIYGKIAILKIFFRGKLNKKIKIFEKWLKFDKK